MALRTLAIGTRVRINMGTDIGKEACVVGMHIIPTDGMGCPRLDRGHYRPIEKSDVAIRFADGTLDVYNRVHLTPLE